jgi:hypothetical protein
MIDARRKRQGPSFVVEGLESRHLLNGAMASPTIAEVHALKAPKATVIKGTIHVHVTSETPLAAGVALVTYSGSGRANLVGSFSVAGQHTIAMVAGKKMSRDTYSAGSATLAASAVVIEATYTGSGHTKSNGRSTATLRGTATAVSGIDAGLSGPIVAQLTGNARTGAFTITFTIKV